MEGPSRSVEFEDDTLWFDSIHSARRTQVIDDESDYFSTDSNKWLTKDDREKLRKRRDELRELKHGSRLKKTFTLDFAGRKVVEDSGKIDMYDGKDEVVQAVNYGKTGQKVKSQKGTVGDIDIINPNLVQDAPHVRKLLILNHENESFENSLWIVMQRRYGFANHYKHKVLIREVYLFSQESGKYLR